MFYLGYHKGTPDDSYTHSSSVMEKFTKTSIPSYMRRRILAMGTEQEMIELENKLLDNRKEKCWDKYHNVTVAFPPPPMYGEDHWNWKGGVSFHPEYAREWNVKRIVNGPVNGNVNIMLRMLEQVPVNGTVNIMLRMRERVRESGP